MKQVLIIMAVVIFTACGDSKEKKENDALKKENEKLKKENASLKKGDIKLQATIADYIKFMKEVESNLAGIDENKTMITKLQAETKNASNTKEDIRQRIVKIKELMENSKFKILAMDKSMAKLRKGASDKSDEILVLDQKVIGLTRDLMNKDIEIEKLDDKQAELEVLYQLELNENEELHEIIDRAYYIVASSKSLKESGMVTKEGGFIGLGKVKIMNANATDDLFTKISKVETEVIELNGIKAKLITNHPEGSYEINEVGQMTITDSQSFWKSGNYLIIETEKK